MNRLKKIIILIVLMLLCSLFTKVYAIENMIGTIDEKDYSSEFKKWLALPEEERKNYIMPNMFSVDLNINDLDEDMAGASTLLEKYSLADNINIRVRNQEETPFCWTFASSKVFETTYAKLNNKTTYEEYSPRHMAYSTSLTFKDNVINPSGFNMEITEGGNYHQALAYYTSGKGPVLEEDMPFVNTIDKIEISDIENKEVQAQLEDAIFFPTIIKSYGLNGNVSYSDGFGSNYSESEIETFRNKIKLHIMEYGAIGAYTFIPQSATDISYFSMLGSNNYFCNNTTYLPNHAITIVGWDDTYSKENFNGPNQSKPSKDGAYIVLNSYGEKFGTIGGYYYISYEDFFIENEVFAIKAVSEIDYDNIYQYDELGMSLGLHVVDQNTQKPMTTMYAANVFNTKSSSNEKLSEVGIYILSNNTNVEIYLSDGSINSSNMKYIGSADNLETGYHTIELDDKIYVKDNFSIIVKYSNTEGVYIPVEMPISHLTDTKEPVVLWDTANSNSGESYASTNGKSWSDITELQYYSKANVCIKAFTVNSTESEEPNEPVDTKYIKNTNWKITEGSNITMIYGIEENTTINSLLSATNFTSGYTAKAYKNGSQVTTGTVTTGTIIKIFNETDEVEEYTVIIYGDTTGNGEISATDALAIVKNNIDIEKFACEVYLEAGRVSKSKRGTDEIPNSVDALACVKHRLGDVKISQL